MDYKWTMDPAGGMITRHHFCGYMPSADPMLPPPMHVRSVNDDANWHPAGRPLEGGGQPGPALVLAGDGMPSLGVDPTDPTTWGGRGYNQSAGMIGRLNLPADWRGNPEQLNPLGMYT